MSRELGSLAYRRTSVRAQHFMTASRIASAMGCGWPAMLLAAVLLAPFLNTPFTVDDPIYLREAQHVLVDPIHPQAFRMVWSSDLNLRASQILPGGVFVPYLLIPTALAGGAEWVGHLTQVILLLAAVFVAALAALRLGLDERQARLTALLTATCPAVLGMAGTVMPDVAAMLFTILGMERIVSWRDERKWHQALAATCWLTLAALTRTHTILILAAAFVLLLDGISTEEIGSSFRNFPVRFLPIVLVPVAFFIVSALTADPESEGENILTTMLSARGGLHLMVQNGCAFLTHYLVVIPLTIPWLVLRFRKIPAPFIAAGLVGASVLALRLGWVAFAAAATFVVLADIAWDALERRDRVQLGLWLWLLLAAPVVIYIHLPSKYLLPSVPAAAILVSRLIPEGRRWLAVSFAAAGAVLGLFILLGVRDLALTQRRAVSELIDPAIKAGERVWFAGHWGFQWYAEIAGASPVTLEPPLPNPGDTIVVSEIDMPRFVRSEIRKSVVRQFCYPSSSIGRVMDVRAGAGFFSSAYGYLPWVWGQGEASCFEVWKAE
jgi:hypothetical protein